MYYFICYFLAQDNCALISWAFYDESSQCHLSLNLKLRSEVCTNKRPTASDIYHDFLDGRSINSSLTMHRFEEEADNKSTVYAGFEPSNPVV